MKLHHGLPALVAEFIGDPDTRRRYGRRMMRGMAAKCAMCQEADALNARLYRMHADYRRRNR